MNTCCILFINFLLTLMIASPAMPSSESAQAHPAEKLAVISTVAPVFPREAAIKRISGKVVVGLSINSKGEVTTAEIIQGHRLLRKATKDAALKWKFAPASISKRDIRLTFVFKDTGDEAMAVLVLPYQIKLASQLEALPDTISRIAQGLEAGKSRCGLHDKVLHKDVVPIIYGLPIPDDGYSVAAEKLFPNASKVVLGGCIVMDAKYAEVLYCSKCRSEEERWVKAHK